MPLPLIAAALAAGAVRGGIGLLTNRSNVRRQRGLINDAYGRGRERLDLQQQDTRQSTGESLNARGLVSGASVSDTGAVQPGAAVRPPAYSLGEGTMSDLHREQGLEQNELVAQRDTALSDVEAGSKQGILDALSSGVSTGLGVYGMGQQLHSGPGASSTPTPMAAGGGNNVGTIRGAFGIDPLNPVMPATTVGVGQPNYDFRRGMS